MGICASGTVMSRPRRDAPPPQAGLRPLRRDGGSGLRRRPVSALAAQIRNAPHRSPSGSAPLTPVASHERLRSMASRRRHHSAARAPLSLATGTDGHRGTLGINSPSPVSVGALRSQARRMASCLQDMDSSGQAVVPPARWANHLAPRIRSGGGEPRD